MTLMKKPTLISGTGMPANGKTTQLDLLAIALGAKDSGGRIVRAEMRHIIKWGAGLHGDLGDSVREHISIMPRGGYVPDHVINPLFTTWFSSLMHVNPKIETILLGGAPRTKPQKIAMTEHFDAYVIFDIEINRERAHQSALKRLESGGEVREDDQGGEAVFNNRLLAYDIYTAPMLAELNGARIKLHRDEHPRIRLKKILEHVANMKKPVLRQSVITRAFNRLRSDSALKGHIENVFAGRGLVKEHPAGTKLVAA
jgi:adenylate kinase family enzyme